MYVCIYAYMYVCMYVCMFFTHVLMESNCGSFNSEYPFGITSSSAIALQYS